tara:strand:- start:454 stop:717 length:264 start_codon:yes stop_codon:yes gene_type:complete
MPLSSASIKLESDIKSVYTTVLNNGISGKPHVETIAMLATDLGKAIHGYMMSAVVSTTDTSDAGQTDLPASGITTVTATGTGTGNLL